MSGTGEEQDRSGGSGTGSRHEPHGRSIGIGPPSCGIVEADETFVLASRKGDQTWKRAKEGKSAPPDRQARKRGGKATKRGLSNEQVPILVAADRSGATVSAVLLAVTADAIHTVLAPVLDKDALLVTDGCTSYPPCAGKWETSGGMTQWPPWVSATRCSISRPVSAPVANSTSRP